MADITERKWTCGQTAAINTHGRDILVSAAAGSGKTATLTERIIRSITNKEAPADISKMLIVTFTRAAANELKERIFLSLGKALAADPANKHLNEQLIKLGSADICTIDAFYLNIIRQNFSTLGISASCRIADNSELSILKKETMDETIDFFYEKDPAFPALAECFIGTKSINRLCEPMLSLYEDLSSHIEGVEFLKIKSEELTEYAENSIDFFETVYGKVIKTELTEFFEYYQKLFNSAYEYSKEYPDIFKNRVFTYEKDLALVTELYDTLTSSESVTYSDIRMLFSSFSPAKLGSAKKEDETPESEYFKAQRTLFKDKMTDFNVRIFSRDEGMLRSEMIKTAENISKLYTVISEFSKRFAEEKTRRSIMDFNDIRQYTYKLLINTDGSLSDIANQYRELYTDIYIDEYQDVDSVQDAIFRAISKNNRFMVGDIKQSIYGFRGAEPEVFALYRSKFFGYDAKEGKDIPNDVKNISIFMSDNFRCDKNIIDFTNLVCSKIFYTCKDSIGYTKEDDLCYSKSEPYAEYVSPTVEVSLILTDKDGIDSDEAEKEKKKNEPTADEIEADFIAEKIASIIEKEKKADGKPILPGDIAILYRSNNMVSVLSEALRKRGILCSEGGGDYFESPDVLLTLSLLNAVDNPHRDIHLAATLCSPLFEFSMDDLIQIKLKASNNFSLYDAVEEYSTEFSRNSDSLALKCNSFIKTLTELRKNASSLPVDRFLRVLFESELFLASGLLADRNDYGEGGNLLRLYEYARTFEAGSFKGLYNFIEFINTLIENGEKLEVSAKEKCPDRVNLTTMHHSKGLEFPICFICGAGKRKNTSELSKSMIFEYPLGITMKLSDSTGFAQINTPLRESAAIKKRIRETEEEMRILYVAMTRARERLYITATSKREVEALLIDAQMRNQNYCSYAIKHCSSFIDWILLPFADTSVITDCCRLDIVAALESDVEEDLEALDREEITLEQDTQLYEHLCNKFDFNYGYSDFLRIPAKISVSRLSPDVLDNGDGALELFSSDSKTVIPDFFITDKQKKASAAERGTATHLFLQFCDFKNIRKNGVEEEISRLTEKRFIPENIAELIYTDELKMFMQGELADKILNAAKVIREQRFNLLLPAEIFSEDKDFAEKLKGETLAVQGVIDLILVDQNGNIELYDYKTDRLTKEELISFDKAKKKMNEHHGLQLSYYAHAVSELFQKKCCRVCVYSTHSGKLYDINTVPLRIDDIK